MQILNREKNEIDLQLDNVTIAEILRVYLNNQGVEFTAWRREHPSKPIVLKVKAGNAVKTIADAISAIKKDCNALASEIKK